MSITNDTEERKCLRMGSIVSKGRETLATKITRIVQRERRVTIKSICEETGAAYDSVRKAIYGLPSVMMQDGGKRAYLCTSLTCEYDGRRYCQNCGFARGESA